MGEGQGKGAGQEGRTNTLAAPALDSRTPWLSWAPRGAGSEKRRC